MANPRISPTVSSLVAAASLLALTRALPSQAPAAKQLPADRASGAQAVTEDQCSEWLHTLASPEFEGRGTGQPGFQKAADFVASHFRSLKLDARDDKGSYFQQVPWSSTKLQADKTFVSFSKGDKEVARIPAERLSGTATKALSAGGAVVLVAVDAPKAEPENAGKEGERRRRTTQVPKFDGLDALDVKDKVVVVLIRGAERRQVPMARFAAQQALQGKEAAAILFAQEDAVQGGLQGRTGAGRGGNPAAAGARRSPLDATFGGDDLKAVLGAAGKKAQSLALATPLEGMRAQVEIAVADEQAPAMNVWAVLPGSNPARKDEYVVIGSHLDHLGKRGTTIHPGADDDGSGTTGVLAVATMFAKNGVRPERSILFVCFCGEENGLVGSRYFATNPPIPLSSIVAELQMDMIGRDEEQNAEGDDGEKAEDNRNSLHLIGTRKLAPALHELCIAKNGTAGFDIEYDQEGMFSRSDHANFARMGVPIAFFFTGLHRDYHQPTDTPDKIHYGKLLRIARYVYDIAFELATQPARPHVDPDLWEKVRDKGSEQPAAPLMPDTGPGKKKGGGAK